MAHRLIQAAANGGGYFRLQAGGVKFIAPNEEVLSEFGAIRLKGNDTAWEALKILLHFVSEASQAERNFRPHRLAADGSLATQIECVRDEGGHPGSVVFEVLAFGRHAHQARDPVAGTPTKTDFGIGLLETHTFSHSSKLDAGGQRLEAGGRSDKIIGVLAVKAALQGARI